MGEAANRDTISQREYLSLLLPFVLSTLTQPLLGAVDTAVMGRLPDPAYIAGVSVGAVIFNTLYWLLGFLRVATTGFSAQAQAASREKSGFELAAAFVRPCLVALALGLVLVLLRGPLFAGAMLIFTLEAPVRAVTHAYFGVLIWGAPLVLVNYVILGWLMGQARMKAALAMQIGGNLVNAALSILFVLGFGWGAEGVAAATLIACGLSFAVGAAAVTRLFPALPGRDAWRDMIRPGAFAKILGVNLDLMLRTACLLVQTNVFTATSSGFGTVTLSANSILIQILLIMAYVFEGLANASSVLAGRAAGRGNPAMLRSVWRRSAQWGAGAAALLLLVYLPGGDTLIRLFTGIAPVVEETLRYAHWAAFFPPVAVLGLAHYGIFTGASVTRPVFLSTLGALLLFLAAWRFAVPRCGNDGLWMAYLAFYLGRTVFLLPWYGFLLRSAAFRSRIPQRPGGAFSA